jgi:hypothetical protein
MSYYLDLNDSSAQGVQYCRFSFIACIDSLRTLLKEDFSLTFLAHGRFSGAGLLAELSEST